MKGKPDKYLPKSKHPYTLRDVRRKAAEVGCTVETGGQRVREVEVISPPGRCFAASPGDHCRVLPIPKFENNAETMHILMDFLSWGLMDCPADCECRR